MKFLQGFTELQTSFPNFSNHCYFLYKHLKPKTCSWATLSERRKHIFCRKSAQSIFQPSIVSHFVTSAIPWTVWIHFGPTHRKKLNWWAKTLGWYPLLWQWMAFIYMYAYYKPSQQTQLLSIFAIFCMPGDCSHEWILWWHNFLKNRKRRSLPDTHLWLYESNHEWLYESNLTPETALRITEEDNVFVRQMI